MKAILNYAKQKNAVKVAQVEKPEPAPGQVRIRSAYAGVCGTDIHIYLNDGGYPTNPPVILGHEFSGVVDAVGQGVDEHRINQRVVSETYYHTCGKCYYCQSGNKNLCPEKKSIGSAVNGAMAEYVVVPEKNLHVIPKNVSMAEAAMTEPLACCAQAVLKFANIKPADTVLITGPGTIGLMCLQLAKRCGGRVIVGGTARDKTRLELAKTLGADEILFTDQKDAKKTLYSFCPQYEPDVAMDCSGAGAAIQFDLDVLRKGGNFVQVGLTAHDISIDWNLITLKQLRVYGSYAQNTEWFSRSLTMLERGEINLKPLITKPFEMERFEEAFQGHINGNGFKFLIKIDDSIQ